MASTSQRLIVLLRGINLANRRRVGMADLRELLAGHGYENVRTHLQSGNVVLTSSLSADRLGQKLEQELERGLGFKVEVIVRTRAELARVVAGNPLAEVAKDPSRYLVTFLRAKPAAKAGSTTRGALMTAARPGGRCEPAPAGPS